MGRPDRFQVADASSIAPLARLALDRAMPISLSAGWPARALGDVADALSFFTRLPLSGAQNLDGKAFAFAHFAWAAPVAGGIVGAIGAAAGAGAGLLALPMTVRAVVAVAAMALVTGAMHEDGFADCVDGFGGGREQGRQTRHHARQPARDLWRPRLDSGDDRESVDVGDPAARRARNRVCRFHRRRARRRGWRPWRPWRCLPPRAPMAWAHQRGCRSRRCFARGSRSLVIALLAGLPSLGVINALFACVLALAAAWGVARLARTANRRPDRRCRGRGGAAGRTRRARRPARRLARRLKGRS